MNAMSTDWTPCYPGSSDFVRNQVMAIRFGGKTFVRNVRVTRNRWSGFSFVSVSVDATERNLSSSLAHAAMSQLIGQDVGWRNASGSGGCKVQGRPAVYSSFAAR